MSLNKVMLIGRLGQDPETKSVGETQVCKFSVATSESWTDRNGDKKENTEWHRITAWGKLAEICGKYLQKGRQVYIEGKIKTTQYEKNGEKRYGTEIVAGTVQFLGSAGDGEKRSTGGDKSSHQEPPWPDQEEDIPF